MTKSLVVIIVAIFLMGCETQRELMPRSDTEAAPLWGYTDMCEDPERYDPIHCEDDNE